MKSRTFKTIFVLTAVCAIGALAAGCGDDDGGNSIPLENMEQEYLRAYCQKLMECPTDWSGNLITDTEQCIELLNEMDGELSEMFTYFQDSVANGRATYNGKQAAKCIQSIQNATCSEMVGGGIDSVEACELAIVGLLEDGESCRTDEECAGGWCDTRDTCPGVCATDLEEGGDCSNGEQCAYDLICEDGECAINPGPLAEGDACTDSSRSCDYGLFCNYDTDQCEAWKAEDEACSGNQQCGPDGICTEAGCKPVTILTDVGEACDPENEGRICDPFAGIVCQLDVSGGEQNWTTCVEATQEGDTCVDTENMLVTLCDPTADIYCDRSDTQLCQPKKAGGEYYGRPEERLSGMCVMNECATMEEDECF